MKKFFKKVMLFASALLLMSCSAPESDSQPAVVMTARIEAFSDRIEVTVLESEYTSGVHLVITSAETEFLDKDGNRISLGDLAVGDTVKITYSGQVMMSYPPQIVAKKITVI